MSKCFAVRFEDKSLQTIALELRKRESVINTLAARCQAGRIDDGEEIGAQGVLPHEGLELRFGFWSDDRELRLTLYDDRSCYLDIFHHARPVISWEGKLEIEMEVVPHLIEQTLRQCAEVVDVDGLTASLAEIWSPMRKNAH